MSSDAICAACWCVCWLIISYCFLSTLEENSVGIVETTWKERKINDDLKKNKSRHPSMPLQAWPKTSRGCHFETRTVCDMLCMPK